MLDLCSYLLVVKVSGTPYKYSQYVEERRGDKQVGSNDCEPVNIISKVIEQTKSFGEDF
jgi:hypothetical protein